MAYSYSVAKDVLSEVDKNRLLACFLNSDHNTINWTKAKEEFGAASVESMRVMVRTAYKKIEKAGGKQGVQGAVSSTPAPSTTKRKAKAALGNDDDDEEDEDRNSGTMKPKPKRGRKARKESPPERNDDDNKDTKISVKAEVNEDDFGFI